MGLVLEGDGLGDLDRLRDREWLETNGIGGYASSTLANLNTRRYHGLLIAATRPPAGRVLMLAKLDETLWLDGRRHELGGNAYPGTVHPQGWRLLDAFALNPFPTFVYRAGPVQLRKTVAAIHGENTTVVAYTLEEAPGPVTLELLPLVAGRDHHSLGHANPRIAVDPELGPGTFAVRPYPETPVLHIRIPGAVFEPDQNWYYQLEYARERERGYDFREDLFCHGRFRLTLTPGKPVAVAISDRPLTTDAGARALERERQRRRTLRLGVADTPEWIQTLATAADQFRAHRGAAGRTVIAGYPWFCDWGRDTMISLPGLYLTTGRHEEAKAVLRTFMDHVDAGMIPNRFPDGPGSPAYNTADATLWFFVAAYKYWLVSADLPFLRSELYPLLQTVLDWHDRGTRHGIRVAADGLLEAGTPDSQLTWMDAKIAAGPVTPRPGKPVEVNALWYNALTIVGALATALGRQRQAVLHHERAARVKRRFAAAFWNPARNCLFDVVTDNHADAALRPNQVMALGLPFPVLEGPKAAAVLRVVEDELLTPFGLRTLARADSGYSPACSGNGETRDRAYHQGTVWAWLLGPYLTAAARQFGPAGARQRSGPLLAQLGTHLETAGIGSVSEIFDGDPPHAARGCIAQAWSVAEILRACCEDLELFAAQPAAAAERKDGTA